jgi:hypothetical protein
VFVGCGDSDPLCPSEWADVTAEILEKTGTNVDKQIYSGMGIVVNDDQRDTTKLDCTSRDGKMSDAYGSNNLDISLINKPRYMILLPSQNNASEPSHGNLYIKPCQNSLPPI